MTYVAALVASKFPFKVGIGTQHAVVRPGKCMMDILEAVTAVVQCISVELV